MTSSAVNRTSLVVAATDYTARVFERELMKLGIGNEWEVCTRSMLCLHWASGRHSRAIHLGSPDRQWEPPECGNAAAGCGRSSHWTFVGGSLAGLIEQLAQPDDGMEHTCPEMLRWGKLRRLIGPWVFHDLPNAVQDGREAADICMKAEEVARQALSDQRTVLDRLLEFLKYAACVASADLAAPAGRTDLTAFRGWLLDADAIFAAAAILCLPSVAAIVEPETSFIIHELRHVVDLGGTFLAGVDPWRVQEGPRLASAIGNADATTVRNRLHRLKSRLKALTMATPAEHTDVLQSLQIIVNMTMAAIASLLEVIDGVGDFERLSVRTGRLRKQLLEEMPALTGARKHGGQWLLVRWENLRLFMQQLRKGQS